jgi:hypothetical protein
VDDRDPELRFDNVGCPGGEWWLENARIRRVSR